MSGAPYPNFPLQSYTPDGQTHFINKDYPGLQCIHENPRIFVVHDFLTAAECDEVMAVGQELGLPAARVNSASGVDQEHRKSKSSAAWRRSRPDKFARLEFVRQRVQQLTRVSDNQLEVSQVTKYDVGDYFKPHHDSYEAGFPHSKGRCPDRLGNRVVTVFVYLNDVNSGGQTRFTELEPQLDVVPKQGMACVFFPGLLKSATHLGTAGGRAPNTKHEGRPVLAGEKWIMQQWCWSSTYLQDQP